MKIRMLYAFFPLIIPVWEKMPLDNENTAVPDSPYFADNASIKLQSDYMARTQDSRLRSKIAITLAYSENPVAVEILENCLQDEKNDYVQADILGSLYSLREHASCKKITLLKGLLKSPNRSVRTFAAALCLRATNDLASAYDLLGSENDEYVINFLWNEIAANKDLAKHTKDSELERFISSENPNQRAGAVKVLAGKSEEPDKDVRLNKVVSDRSMVVKAALASSLAAREKGAFEMLGRLAADSDVTIRAFVASSKPSSDRLQIFIKLSSDPDDEVRRLACIAMGAYKEPAAIDALLARTSDKMLQVRDAAEASLIKIAPGQDVLKKIGDELLESKESRAVAVTVIGALKDTRYSQAIMKILESLGANDPDADLVRRCVTALGELDFKESWKPVSDRAEHSDAAVREAVASTLGKLKIKDSFTVIVKLSDDKVLKVSTQAFESMGWIADSYFNPTLLAAIKKTVAEYPADNRSYSCWSIARIGVSSHEILNQLDALCMKMVLKVPMSPNTYDVDSVRISALLTLIELGKKDPVAKEKGEAVLKAFLAPPRNEDTFSSMLTDALKDYARQVKAYVNGEKAGPVAVRTRMPNFLIEEFKDRNAAQPAQQ